MAFDIDLIKKVYSEMSSKIEHAKKIIGKPLTLTEKFYTPIYGTTKYLMHMKEALIMLILVLIVLHVKMLLLKWHYFNLCKLVSKRLRFQQLFIVTI